MTFIDRIAVMAGNYRYDTTFAGKPSKATQVDALGDFIDDFVADHIRHVTTDPDVGRNIVRDELDFNWDLTDWMEEHEGDNNRMVSAILKAKDDGYTDEVIVEAIRESILAVEDDGHDSTALCWQSLGVEDLPLDGVDGEVDGVRVPDVFKALTVGLSDKEIADAFGQTDYALDKQGDHHYVSIGYGDTGWAGYFRDSSFTAALEEVSHAEPLFNRGVNPGHGTGGGKDTMKVSHMAVPHAKEQLLRHLLRFAK